MLVPDPDIVRTAFNYTRSTARDDSAKRVNIVKVTSFARYAVSSLTHRKPTYEYRLVAYDDFNETLYDQKSRVAHPPLFTSIGPLRLHLRPQYAMYHCGKKLAKSGFPPTAMSNIVGTETLSQLLDMYITWTTTKPPDTFFGTSRGNYRQPFVTLPTYNECAVADLEKSASSGSDGSSSDTQLNVKKC